MWINFLRLFLETKHGSYIASFLFFIILFVAIILFYLSGEKRDGRTSNKRSFDSEIFYVFFPIILVICLAFYVGVWAWLFKNEIIFKDISRSGAANVPFYDMLQTTIAEAFDLFSKQIGSWFYLDHERFDKLVNFLIHAQYTSYVFCVDIPLYNK